MVMSVESNVILAWPHARRAWRQGLFWVSAATVAEPGQVVYGDGN